MKESLTLKGNFELLYESINITHNNFESYFKNYMYVIKV